MKICPNCETPNREGTLLCEECGQPLTGVPSTATTILHGTDTLGQKPSVKTWGTDHFALGAALVIRIRETNESLTLQVGANAQLIIGRIDPNTGAKPEIDLHRFFAQEKGVSRVHAALRRVNENLTLTDLGSINGTHLNGQKLAANQARTIHDGDEVRIGKLVVHVYFK